MKRFIIKHRKALSIWGGILFIPTLYALSISWIHFQNARIQSIFDQLETAAQKNGLLVHTHRRPPQPSNLIRFTDETNPFRSSHGGTGYFVGYKDLQGNIILPAIYQSGDKYFHDGLAYVIFEGNRDAFIHPDGSIAFKVMADYVDPFFNGRAILKNQYPSRGYPRFREAVIDDTGQNLTGFRYYRIREFLGEPGDEYSMVTSPTIYYPIFEILMDGIDIHIPPFEILLPPVKASFIDKDGNKASASEVKQSIKRLNQQLN